MFIPRLGRVGVLHSRYSEHNIKAPHLVVLNDELGAGWAFVLLSGSTVKLTSSARRVRERSQSLQVLPVKIYTIRL